MKKMLLIILMKYLQNFISKKMIKILKWLLLIISIPIVLLCLFWGISYIYNEIQIYKIENKIINSYQKENIQILDENLRFGILYGNSNHCDLEIMFIIKSNKEIVEIQKIYKPQVIFKLKNSLNILDNHLYFDLMGLSEIGYIKKFIRKNYSNNENLYFVYVFQQWTSGLGFQDKRCH